MNYLLYFKQIHEQLVVRKKFHINQKDIQNMNRYRMSQSYHNYPPKVNTSDAVNFCISSMTFVVLTFWVLS